MYMKKKKVVKDIWKIIEEENGNKEFFKPVQDTKETNVLFLGSKGAGKSTLIQRFLGKDESLVKPSVALEYRYGKKETKVLSSVVHVWELAGVLSLISLVDEILTVSNLHTYVIVIVLDLSDSANTLYDLISFLEYINKLCTNYYKFMNSKGSTNPGKMDKRIKQRFGVDHQDLKKVKFSGIPTIIIGNKFDQFQDSEQKKLKVMNRSLRYVSQLYGCSLHFSGRFKDSKETEENHQYYRELLNHYIFGTKAPINEPQFDEKFPASIMSGKDTFLKIEENPAIIKPTLKDEDLQFKEIEADEKLYKWYKNYSHIFGKNTSSQEKEVTKLNFEFFKEKKIDLMRQQKDEELTRYKKELDRKRKKKEREKKRRNQLSRKRD